MSVFWSVLTGGKEPQDNGYLHIDVPAVRAQPECEKTQAEQYQYQGDDS